MDLGLGNFRANPAHPPTCRLVIQKEEGLVEALQFITAGLEIGQQVVVMAGAPCLKDLARELGDNGLRPGTLLHNGRLTFLTAPNCLSLFSKANDPLRRSPLHRNGSVLRWISDWSWAYAKGYDPATILDYQRHVHHFVSSLTTLSLCTIRCEKIERTSLLALLADHRRAARAIQRPV